MAKSYLDNIGLTHLWSKIKSKIDAKQNKITYGSAEPTGGTDGDVYLMTVNEDTADKVGDLSTLTTEDKSSVVGAINEINTPPIVLYDGASLETITLSDNVVNYSYIEIFYRYGNSYYSSLKIHSPNGKTANMVGVMVNHSSSAIYFSATNSLISGVTITPQYFGEYTITSGSWAYKTNRIYITRVIGYK